MRYSILIISLFIIQFQAFAQTASDRDRAFIAVSDLKENGVLIVRLDTKDVKIKVFQRALAASTLKEKKRKRIQKMLDETINEKDAINLAMASAFRDSFSFCPVFICFDTSSNSLKAGIKKGIFYDTDLNPAPELTLPDSASIFVVYYHERSGEYPSDGLILRKLRGLVEEPFPKFTAIRESFVYNINTPRIAKAAIQIDRRLQRLYNRADEKIKD
jgi:hypothetical protein